MKKNILFILMLLSALYLAIVFAFQQRASDIALKIPNENRTNQNQPTDDFEEGGAIQQKSVTIFAERLGKPRMMAFSPSGVLFISITQQGRVVALPDDDSDGKADKVVNIITNLNLPHGLAFHENNLYIAEEDRIIRLKNLQEDFTYEAKEVILSGLPATGNHFTRTLVIGPDENLYISVGSSCNVCVEKHPWRAAVLKTDINGRGVKVFAKGLRNSVGIIFHPETQELWGTDNGRDWLGDDLPPEEINIIKEGGDYGWPYCFGQKTPDTEFDKRLDQNTCAVTNSPQYELGAHMAPLGLRFYQGMQFPELQGNLLVALHGSWNRSVPVGYKVIGLKLEKNKIISEHTLLILSNLPNKPEKFRPVDIIVGNSGEIFISDDYNGIIYRVTKI